MKPTTLIPWTLAIVIPVGVLCGGLIAANVKDDKSSDKLSIRGSYMLEYRMLPDGKKVVAPDVIGMMTFTESSRNLNVFWTAGGKTNSISLIAKYTLTDKAYTESSIYYAADFDGKGMTYETAASQGTSAVTSNGGKTQFQFPLHGEPSGEFDKHSLTATKAGAFVDYWKKID